MLEELDRRAGNEGPRRCGADIMQGLSGEHFARTAFAFYGSDAQMAGRASHPREEPLHERAAPDYGAKGPLGPLAEYDWSGRRRCMCQQSFFDALWRIQGPRPLRIQGLSA